jgi:GNAT superfamily N-acetyltransferase
MNCEIKSGIENMQFDRITAWLSEAYWSEGIGKSEVILSACNSAYVVGVFDDGVQVGYARVISDKYRFAYILDVIIEPSHRNKGLGSQLLDSILNCQELKHVYQWLLITHDAHEFYEKAGFKKLTRTDDWYEIRNPRPSDRSI